MSQNGVQKRSGRKLRNLWIRQVVSLTTWVCVCVHVAVAEQVGTWEAAVAAAALTALCTGLPLLLNKHSHECGRVCACVCVHACVRMGLHTDWVSLNIPAPHITEPRCGGGSSSNSSGSSSGCPIIWSPVVYVDCVRVCASVCMWWVLGGF